MQNFHLRFKPYIWHDEKGTDNMMRSTSRQIDKGVRLTMHSRFELRFPKAVTARVLL